MTPQPPPIESLVAEARTGSQHALGCALDACRDFLLRIAADELDPALRPKVGCSDLVQDTLLEAQRDFPQFRGRTEAELLSWLRQILRRNLANCTRDYLGTAKRDAAREVRLEPADSSDGPRDLAASDPTPSARAAEAEERRAVEAALARLPEAYQQVVRLRHFDGLALEEVARAMGRSTEAVRRLWARAIERLQRELEVGG